MPYSLSNSYVFIAIVTIGSSLLYLYVNDNKDTSAVMLYFLTNKILVPEISR